MVDGAAWSASGFRLKRFADSACTRTSQAPSSVDHLRRCSSRPAESDSLGAFRLTLVGPGNVDAPVQRIDVLGGLIHEYRRGA
jgi:hypothetical protein